MTSWEKKLYMKKFAQDLLEKNMHPAYLIDKEIKSFLNNKLSKDNFNEKHISYHRLPYIGDISVSNKEIKLHCYGTHQRSYQKRINK